MKTTNGVAHEMLPWMLCWLAFVIFEPVHAHCMKSDLCRFVRYAFRQQESLAALLPFFPLTFCFLLVDVVEYMGSWSSGASSITL